jgi:hypothetical protein
MVYWKSLSKWSLAVNLNDLVASIPFPASQVETVEVETFLLSSQGSRIVNVEKSPIVYSFLVRAHNLQILRIKQGSTPMIDWSIFATLLFVAIANIKRSTLSILVLLPMTVDYLDRWAPSSSVSRSYDAMTSLYPRFPQPYSRRRDRVSWPCWAPYCIHQIPDWVNWSLQPRSGYKVEPFNQNRRYESSYSVQARQYHCSCSSSTYFNPLEQTVLPCSFPTSRRSSEQTESRNQSKLPPMTPSSEELESFRWTLLGMYLCIVGGLCLLIAVHVHIHRPLPHERRWGSQEKHLVPFCPICISQSWGVWMRLYQFDIVTFGCPVCIAYREQVS